MMELLEHESGEPYLVHCVRCNRVLKDVLSRVRSAGPKCHAKILAESERSTIAALQDLAKRSIPLIDLRVSQRRIGEDRRDYLAKTHSKK